MSLPRGLMQVLVIGTSIVGKAFLNAGRQVIKNVQSTDAASASTTMGGTAAAAGANSLTRLHKMTLDEAHKILNVRDVRLGNETELHAMLKNYETIFKQNENTTFLLQSKVVRARQRIEAELEAERERLGLSASRSEGNDQPPSSPPQPPSSPPPPAP